MSAISSQKESPQRWEQLWIWGAHEDIQRALAAVDTALGEEQAARLAFQGRHDLWAGGHWVGTQFDWRLLCGGEHPRARVDRFWRVIQNQPGVKVMRMAGGRGRHQVRCFGNSTRHWLLPAGVSAQYETWSKAIADSMRNEWRSLRTQLPVAPKFQSAALNESWQDMGSRWSGVVVQAGEVEAWWAFMARFLHRRSSPVCQDDAWGPPVFMAPQLIFDPILGHMEEVGGTPDSGQWSPLPFYQQDTLRALALALPRQWWDLPRLNALIGPGLFADEEIRPAVFECTLETPLLVQAGPEEFWRLRQHKLDFTQLSSFAVVETFKALPLAQQLEELDAALLRWRTSPNSDVAFGIIPLLHAACPLWPHWLEVVEACAPAVDLLGAEDLLALLQQLRVEDRQAKLDQALPAMATAPEAARL